jgi:hypothetical protein
MEVLRTRTVIWRNLRLPCKSLRHSEYRLGGAQSHTKIARADPILSASKLADYASRVTYQLLSLVTPRFAFTHHGIYVGDGRVVHYGSLRRRRPGGPVQEVTLERFAQGQPVWIRWHALPRFRRLAVIRRARLRIGENSYRLLSNNCEHFCEWCLYGEHRSYQVEKALLFPLVARFFRGAVARWQTPLSDRIET